MGPIIDKIDEYHCFDNHYTELLNKSNNNRIFLAHMFWWERDIKFNDDNELVKLHKEIFSYIDLFNHLIPVIDKYIENVREENNLDIEKKMGLTTFEAREAYIKALKK